MLIAPIALSATETVDPSLRGAASAVVSAMRIVGMTFGLAALAAWGVGRFQQLVVGVELPLPQPGETAEQTQSRMAEFNANLIEAGMTVFTDFFTIAAALAVIALARGVVHAAEIEPSSHRMYSIIGIA